MEPIAYGRSEPGTSSVSVSQESDTTTNTAALSARRTIRRSRRMSSTSSASAGSPTSPWKSLMLNAIPIAAAAR